MNFWHLVAICSVSSGSVRVKLTALYYIPLRGVSWIHLWFRVQGKSLTEKEQQQKQQARGIKPDFRQTKVSIIYYV